MTRTKKIIAALCLALGLVGAVATPALADNQKPGPGAAAASPATDVGITDAADCIVYLVDKGYTVGPTAKSACITGASGNVGDITYCLVSLIRIGVHEDHAGKACEIART
jgi:hypothetical protein